ncbi:MAG TPA: hypothetical protein QF865_05535, partial [Acidimicrobiales bacterium]|nr:hypothetical protein [Acidimicrobiales bacterium]
MRRGDADLSGPRSLPGHVAERLRGISHDGYFRLTLLPTGACSPASGGDSPASGRSTIDPQTTVPFVLGPVPDWDATNAQAGLYPVQVDSPDEFVHHQWAAISRSGVLDPMDRRRGDGVPTCVGSHRLAQAAQVRRLPSPSGDPRHGSRRALTGAPSRRGWIPGR